MHSKQHQGVKDAKNGTMASISKHKASKGGPQPDVPATNKMSVQRSPSVLKSTF